ncbi:hypothetical protein FKG94_02515 [Exilibacterium tricleocarpae]|uniref:Cytochrome c domain-containing protein n=1 Tax=Exilibacterium tricleocarpae TaxID=2591008 RepID=A0A545U8D5_9GAMM|nr:di-heme-cytochrome C peroxidase [Exilibacterium tricleocarpae]TQV85735.1 hypothetical protein FKG94_02515 [Exilibacterium tricleocarpae]
MRSRWHALALLLAGAVTLSNCSVWSGDDYADARPAEGLPWWEVSQGWSDTQRKQFWFMDQGSRLLPYDWFLHLELEDSTQLLRADANIERLGYIPAPADPTWNPDGLPIGLAKGGADTEGTVWLGPTCALCHVNRIALDGKPTLIDGAPTLGDFETFNQQIIDALLMTWTTAEKFDRFAGKVLGDNASSAARAELMGKMQLQTQVLAIKQEQNRGPYPYGHGRVDAIGAIFNQVTAQILKAPDNWRPADAPVSYPFLWGASQSSVVQWTGLAPNDRAGFGPLMRNVGEVIGVFGVVEVVNRSGDAYLRAEDTLEDHLRNASRFGYRSSVNMENLGRLEKLVRRLRAPRWPANLLPAPDPAKAARGEAIYRARCIACHALVARRDQYKSYEPVMIEVAKVGTDPKVADNFLLATNTRTGQPWASGKLEGTHAYVIGGDRYGPELPTRAGSQPISPRGSALVTVGTGVLLGHPPAAVKAAFQSYSRARAEKTFNPRSYKARPLNGIWATAPYLHNGSVPNLFELLLAPEHRATRFYVGSREFDPIKVGYRSDAGTGGFEFDTRLAGNHNGGHPYGSGLTDAEKFDLVEFLKTL